MLNTAYMRPKDIPVKDLAKAASFVLPRLFVEEDYSENEKFIYQCICHRNMEDFIDRELFTYSGIIIFNIPDKIAKESETAYRFATAYFLHCRHNAKMQRGYSDKYNMKIFDDWLYELLKVAADKCCNDWAKKQHVVPSQEKFFAFFKTLSFVFEAPNMRYVWDGADYSAKNNACVRIKLSVTTFDDENKSYGELIQSLMTKRRNGIADFENSAIFWRNVVKIRRGANTYRFEENRALDKDLLILCLSLAMDDNFYDLLRSKRDELPASFTKSKFKLPYVGDDEINILRERLMYAGEHLRSATENANISDEYSVPRRMLFEANLYLLQTGKRPIIPLVSNETVEVKKRNISEELLNEFYQEGTLQERNIRVPALLLKIPFK